MKKERLDEEFTSSQDHDHRNQHDDDDDDDDGDDDDDVDDGDYGAFLSWERTRAVCFSLCCLASLLLHFLAFTFLVLLKEISVAVTLTMYS